MGPMETAKRTLLLRLIVLVVLLLGSSLIADSAQAQIAPTTGHCGKQGTLNSQVAQGTLPHGALYLICVPASGWNGDVVVYAHGYTPVTAPLDFQNLTLP